MGVKHHGQVSRSSLWASGNFVFFSESAWIEGPKWITNWSHGFLFPMAVVLCVRLPHLLYDKYLLSTLIWHCISLAIKHTIRPRPLNTVVSQAHVINSPPSKKSNILYVDEAERLVNRVILNTISFFKFINLKSDTWYTGTSASWHNSPSCFLQCSLEDGWTED